MDYKLYRIKAFTDRSSGGNPAGVVIDADKLSDKEMLSIAKEVGYSETAFVMKSGIADFKVKFFTPTEEVDLCGHATIGTFNLLRDLEIVGLGDYTQETKAGLLKIRIEKSSVYMEQNLPKFLDTIEKQEIEECFLDKKLDFFGNTPIQIVSTGLKDIIVPINSLESLVQIKPDFEAIKKLSEKYDIIGLHLFTFESFENNTAFTRNFAPRVGINEESATGTSNGALACYINRYSENKQKNFVMEQGDVMGAPSRICVELQFEKEKVNVVYVGGKALKMD